MSDPRIAYDINDDVLACTKYAVSLFFEWKRLQQKTDEADKRLNDFVRTHEIDHHLYDTDTNSPDADDECPDCGGTGAICVPAHQRGGEIVDEQCEPCICQGNNWGSADDAYDISDDR